MRGLGRMHLRQLGDAKRASMIPALCLQSARPIAVPLAAKNKEGVGRIDFCGDRRSGRSQKNYFKT